LVQIISLRSLSIGVGIIYDKNAPQASLFMKQNAQQARFIKQNAPQANFLTQSQIFDAVPLPP